MNVLYCGDILQLFPSYSDFKDRRWILIAGCISNNFLTYTAIMLNIVTLYAVYVICSKDVENIDAESCCF